MKKKKQGFTLVELLVTITILAILGTIAFISFGNFTIGARDSVRISDTKSIGSVIENFKISTGIYPKPSNSTDITYSGGTLFSQGTFGRETMVQMGSRAGISKIPLDPLFDNEYVYSLQSTNKSYNLSYIIEGDLVFNKLNKKTYAAESKEVLVQVKGNYNGQVSHTSTGGQVYVFAIPSLIVSDLSDTNILNLNDKFVYEGEPNIPEVYSGSITPIGSFSYSPKLVYSGSTLPKTPTQLKVLIANTKDAITGTYLYAKPEYRELVELDTNNANEVLKWGENYVSDELGGRLKLKYAKNCKEVQVSEDNEGSGMYTISPDGYTKIDVYCDMDTNGGGWTRIRKWERDLGYTDLKTVNDTKEITGSEVFVTYTRKGNDNVGKKFGLYYTRFKTRQCGKEHTTISDLVSQITGGSWGVCGRDATTGDYNDILVDDLGTTAGKKWDGFDPDPCVVNGYKNTARNTSWTSMGTVHHRIDSSTSLIDLGGSNSPRCKGSSNDSQGFMQNEVFVR